MGYSYHLLSKAKRTNGIFRHIITSKDIHRLTEMAKGFDQTNYTYHVLNDEGEQIWNSKHLSNTQSQN